MVAIKSYVPKAGDVVWLEFDPQTGHEQKGVRPALVLSPNAYNAKTGMMVVCPITNQVKGYPFEVVIPANANVTGAVLADQVKNLDWQARNAQYKDAVSVEVMQEVRGKIKALLGIK
jgi:mRNA interferase MazF